MLVVPDALIELSFCPFPAAAGKSKRKWPRAKCDGSSEGHTRAPAYASVGSAWTSRSDPRYGQIACGLQPTVRRPDDFLGMETHQGVVGQVLQPVAKDFPSSSMSGAIDVAG